MAEIKTTKTQTTQETQTNGKGFEVEKSKANNKENENMNKELDSGLVKEEIKKEVKKEENKIENIGKPKPWLWKKGQSGNQGRKKTEFSLKNDLIKALKRIKHRNPDKYREIIESYWENKGMRQFLMEIIDGKARQSTELSGNLQNPIRIIEVRPMIEEENKVKK